MRSQSCYAIILLCLFVLSAGCSRNAKSGIGGTNLALAWNPDTRALDDMPVNDANCVTLDQDVRKFYDLLREKDWGAAYDFRSKTFKSDFPETTYLNWAQQEATNWELADYEVLSVSRYGTDDAALRCKFIELPGPIISYATVNWHKEKDGVWRCNAAGPIKLPIFLSTRYGRNANDN